MRTRVLPWAIEKLREEMGRALRDDALHNVCAILNIVQNLSGPDGGPPFRYHGDYEPSVFRALLQEIIDTAVNPADPGAALERDVLYLFEGAFGGHRFTEGQLAVIAAELCLKHYRPCGGGACAAPP